MKYLTLLTHYFSKTPEKVVFIALLIAFTLSVIPFSHQLFFYYDQARDGYEAYNIWQHHDIKILGPSTDIRFLHHGVLWYYLLAVLYGIFHQAVLPTASIFLLAFFLTLPITYLLAKELFHSRKIAGIAVILYAFSPLFQLSTRWLSNPVLSLICMPFLLLCLWRYISQQSPKNALLTGVMYGLVIQSQLAFILLLIFLPVYFLVFKIRVRIKDIFLFVLGLILTSSTIILGEAKYHFQGTTSLIHFILSPHSSSQSIFTPFQTMIAKVNELLTVSVLSLPVLLPLVLFALLLLLALRKRAKSDTKPLLFLVIWLTNLLIFCLFDTGISRSLFVFYPSLVVVVILFSYALTKVITSKYLLVIGILGIIITQVWLNLTWIRDIVNPLTVQRGITLTEEQKILEYTYTSSHQKPFSINTVTEPLFINTTWAYLYNFYGQRRYGFVPYWDGKDQTGNLGELPTSHNSPEFHYLIIEPTTGIPDYFVKAAIDEENARSKILEEKHFGNFVVQKRQSLAEIN